VPELPEVETVVRDLRPRLVGCRLAAVEVSELPLRKRWSAEWARALAGRRVQQVRRRGKWIVLDLDRDLHLVFHLGMTGQLVVAPAKEPRLPHTHLVFALDRGAERFSP
jgi:formamidopyrimidine-DNA glycosylase